jgi:chorismate lyase / 3-hydroxybenzoate synthase
MSPATGESPSLRISLGREPSAVFDVGVPVLAGDETDDLFAEAKPVARSGALALFEKGEWLLGAASVPAASGLEPAARRLYLDIFQATRGLHLARVWNYVPEINATGSSGLENYRAFCEGRSLAYEQTYGATFKYLVPAASAVGGKSPALTVVFAACHDPPLHVENPAQVPAYEYPREYGPRPPSFARATIVPANDHATVFISGTAAIRGHATVAPDGIAGQLECTLENLREISCACGLGPNLDLGGPSSRYFKVYVRRAADKALVAAAVDERLLSEGDRVSYIHADICRKPLLVEIEVALVGVTNTSRFR